MQAFSSISWEKSPLFITEEALRLKKRRASSISGRLAGDGLKIAEGGVHIKIGKPQRQQLAAVGIEC